MRDVEAEERDDVEGGKDGDGEEEELGADEEGEGVVPEVCAASTGSALARRCESERQESTHT